MLEREQEKVVEHMKSKWEAKVTAAEERASDAERKAAAAASEAASALEEADAAKSAASSATAEKRKAGEKGNVEHVALVDDESIGRGKGKRGAGGAPVTPETMKPTRAVRRRASP